MSGSSYHIMMESLPLLISYPRSGSNWLNCIMELYFDRPRLRAGPVTFLSNRDNRSDYMWFHDHDIHSDLVVTHSNILYLVRNPVDVIYSILRAEQEVITDALVNQQIERLKSHYIKYNKYTTIKYELLKTNLSREFPKILKFFNILEPIDVKRLEYCNHKVNKKQVINKERDKRYFSDKLLSSEYEESRNKFTKKYECIIHSNVKDLIKAI